MGDQLANQRLRNKGKAELVSNQRNQLVGGGNLNVRLNFQMIPEEKILIEAVGDGVPIKADQGIMP